MAEGRPILLKLPFRRFPIDAFFAKASIARHVCLVVQIHGRRFVARDHLCEKLDGRNLDRLWCLTGDWRLRPERIKQTCTHAYDFRMGGHWSAIRFFEGLIDRHFPQRDFGTVSPESR